VFSDFMLSSVFDLSLDCSTNFEALTFINNLDASFAFKVKSSNKTSWIAVTVVSFLEVIDFRSLVYVLTINFLKLVACFEV
jgi:hypothetical protein